MAVFVFENLGLKPKKFLGFESKFQIFKVWVWALLSSLQLLTGKDRSNMNSDFSVIADYNYTMLVMNSVADEWWFGRLQHNSDGNFPHFSTPQGD